MVVNYLRSVALATGFLQKKKAKRQTEAGIRGSSCFASSFCSSVAATDGEHSQSKLILEVFFPLPLLTLVILEST